MTDAQDRGWGPGWPRCATDKWEPLEVFSFDGRLIRFPAHRIRSENGRLVFEEEVGFPGGVREEIHELVTLLLRESERRGYINLQPGWCWGGACRPIKRSDGTLTDVPSNHSWGLAVDINAPENPYGGSTHTIGGPMADLWANYGFRWGGEYGDPMHFEFVGTPAGARFFTETARRELGIDKEDAMFQEWKAGWDAHESGKQQNEDWTGMKKQGWRDREHVIREAVAQAKA
jgi:hypothetical protein